SEPHFCYGAYGRVRRCPARLDVRMMPVLAAWYDFRDLSNLSNKILDWVDGWGPPEAVYIASAIIGILAILAFLVPSQLAVIWIERRLIGRLQIRLGPNRVCPFGLLQPLADALKV